jgi:hypothetical protein
MPTTTSSRLAWATVRADDVYEVELRKTPRYRTAMLWVANLWMATTPETTRPLSVWDVEAVVRDRHSRRRLGVIRNDSSGASDRVRAASDDARELSAEAFAQLYL